jgi:hypothetical protein
MKPARSSVKPDSDGGLQRERLRPLRTPSPIEVQTDEHGLPRALQRRGKRFRVAAVRERWRIDDEWWRRPISREYFALVLEDGRPAILFRDLVTGDWFGQ